MWDADTKGDEMTPELARQAVDAILSMMEWARNVSDEYLDSDPEQRRQLVEDRSVAMDTVRKLNAAIADAEVMTDGPETPNMRESAWLVELGCNPPMWWTGRPQNGHEFAYDAGCAMRFARREDAEGAIGHLVKAGQSDGCKATEHVWMDKEPGVKLRTASESVGWLNSEGPLNVSPVVPGVVAGAAPAQEPAQFPVSAVEALVIGLSIAARDGRSRPLTERECDEILSALAATSAGAAPLKTFTYQPLYSGDLSIQFWRWVGTLDEDARNTVYALACEIQEREVKIRQWAAHAAGRPQRTEK